MIKLGEYQYLTLNREASVGFYLLDRESGEEVLLPRKYLLEEMQEGRNVGVFVYRDTKDRLVATTEEPLIFLDGFAYLEVAEINQMGAFLDWGLIEKQLLVPFKNQETRMQVGNSYVVHMYKDRLTDRLVGTSKLDNFLKKQAPNTLSRGEEVRLLVRKKTDLGVSVIVNQAYSGLVFANEVFRKLKIGEEVSGYVKQVREDGKLDISLQPIGYASIEPNAAKILQQLKQAEGFLPYTDKSDPEAIREAFAMSKKLFKKAIGSLYKQKLILLKEDGIYLVA